MVVARRSIIEEVLGKSWRGQGISEGPEMMRCRADNEETLTLELVGIRGLSQADGGERKRVGFGCFAKARRLCCLDDEEIARATKSSLGVWSGLAEEEQRKGEIDHITEVAFFYEKFHCSRGARGVPVGTHPPMVSWSVGLVKSESSVCHMIKDVAAPGHLRGTKNCRAWWSYAVN